MPSKIGDCEQISKAILSGDGIASTQAAERALESGKSYDELRVKGLKVYCPKKGVKICEVTEALSDPHLSFVVLSCTEQKTQSSVQDFVRRVKEQRKSVAVIAGGWMANEGGADLVLNDLSELGHIILGYSENA